MENKFSRPPPPAPPPRRIFGDGPSHYMMGDPDWKLVWHPGCSYETLAAQLRTSLLHTPDEFVVGFKM